MTAMERNLLWLQLADSVEKLLFRSYSKNYRPAEASLVLGRGGPRDLLLRATRVVLINAATIRGVNCRLQRTDARIRGHCNLEFFNRIGRELPFTCVLAGCQSERAPRAAPDPGSCC